MKLSWQSSTLIALAITACSGSSEQPKLIVLIGIDQFRASYLEQYDSVFTGGFRRLRDMGAVFDQAVVDHAPTLSYPGHTTLATGALPRHHGITSNAWIETLPNGEKRRTFVMQDTTAGILGLPDQGGVSPHNVRVTDIADWVRAADTDARAVALSTGPALAQVYAGRALETEDRNHAYWLSSVNGRFVTSTYFRTEYPAWVERFNNNEMPVFHKNRVWESSVPERHRSVARRDSASYEGDRVHVTFPHRFEETLGVGDRGPDYDPVESDPGPYFLWFFNSPFADEALFSFAETAIAEMQLGQRNTTDVLAIAIKSVDRIGHDYGPMSQEQLDVLVRLDRLLGEFLTHLDDTIGDGNYVVGLSADHGAPNVTEYEIEEGRAGTRVSEQEIAALLADVEQFVTQYDGPDGELTERMVRRLEAYDFVGRAMTPAELEETGTTDPILAAYRNSYIPDRNTPFPLWTREVLAGNIGDSHPANWGIVVEFAENAQLWTAPSTHMSANAYDRLVPIVFFGGVVRPGTYGDSVRTVDLAPTLARLAGIEFPGSVDGVALDVGKN
jgi:predicted AlkP superfamily pyrophosphatase or phosphodiesterase